VTTHRREDTIAATLRELSGLLVAANRCARRLGSLVAIGRARGSQKSASSRVLRAETRAAARVIDFDRYQWGRTVAAALAPEFDSQQFARRFRAALPEPALGIFDPVRLKKILLRLCREHVIEMISAGRGRTPARYRIIGR